MDALLGVVTPAVLAGLVAIAVTVAIERLGGVAGGLVGTLPSTIVPATVGIWFGASVPSFVDAMAVVPVGMFVNSLFLWVWKVLPPRLPPGRVERRLATVLTVSLVAWAVTAAGLVGALRSVSASGAPLLPFGLAALLATGAWGAVGTRVAVPAPGGVRRVSLGVFAARGVLAAAAVALATLLARNGNGLVAGLATVFPAIYLTTMVSLWVSQGEAVPSGAIGPMMLGSAAVGAYALVAAVAFPVVGPWAGTGVAWVVAVATTTVPSAFWLRRPLRVARRLQGSPRR